MLSHLRKDQFNFVAMSVMVLEVAAFLVFVFGTLGAVIGTYSGISTTDFILLGFGGVFVSLMLMASAEMLQLIMKIEYNTRKENTLMREQTQMQEAEMQMTKTLVSALRKPRMTISGKKAMALRPRRVFRRAMIKKVKPMVRLHR